MYYSHRYEHSTTRGQFLQSIFCENICNSWYNCTSLKLRSQSIRLVNYRSRSQSIRLTNYRSRSQSIRLVNYRSHSQSIRLTNYRSRSQSINWWTTDPAVKASDPAVKTSNPAVKASGWWTADPKFKSTTGFSYLLKFFFSEVKLFPPFRHIYISHFHRCKIGFAHVRKPCEIFLSHMLWCHLIVMSYIFYDLCCKVK
jgi:hypothetical protein